MWCDTRASPPSAPARRPSDDGADGGVSAARKEAVLRAARPNVGVQLTDVVAKLNGEAAGYRLEATGGSPYGPFFANTAASSPP